MAVQKARQREEYQIGVKNLVDFFVGQKMMSKQIGKEILEINELRNTFHLNKSREKIICDVVRVEHAFKILADVLEKVPKSLLKSVG